MDENQEFRLTFPTVFSYTIPIFSKNEDNSPQIAAGVLVKVADKLLVATAAHCIAKDPVVLPEKEFFIPPDPGGVAIIAREIDKKLDIGLLELREDDAFKALCKSCCLLGQVSLAPIPKGGMCHVVGFPNHARKLSGRTYEVVKQGFGSVYQEQEGDFFMFPYPEKGWTHGVGTNEYEPADFHPTPHGFSGGGCWAFLRPQPEEMFVPEKHIKLMAVQSAWWAKRRVVQCVPIRCWLELVHQAYPNLRPLLEAQFLSLPAS